MDIIGQAIRRPVAVAVGIILVVLFGIIGLRRMPYQLSPAVVEPEITVTTTWRGATPYEVERDIIEEQEKVLKGIPGLVEMESDSMNGRGSISLRFSLDTDVDDALLRVSNKLNEVPTYPEDVDKPVITATGAATSPVIWMVMKAEAGNPRDIDTYRTFFENEVRQHLERVEGVADLFVGGGRVEELHMVVSPERLAAFGLTVNDIISALRAENSNVSAGTMGVGRRDFRIRTTAEFKSPEDVEGVVLRSTGQRRVFLGDVAEVSPGYAKRTAAMIHNGEAGIAVGVTPEPDANVLEMTDRVYGVVERLNEEKMRPNGIYFDWVYDQRPYIRSAIRLVQNDILLGGALAVGVLLIFLQSVSSTVVVSAAIPLSIIGTFIVLSATGRTLNTVSLAGIAFSVGMFIDNAIVVLENIDRHRGMGKPPIEAAYDGAREVWGAVLTATLTNVAVFLPVVFLKEEAGQLFRDIAIAVSTALLISIFVSALVIPMLSNKLYSLRGAKQVRFAGLASIIDGFLSLGMRLVRMATGTAASRAVTVAGLTLASVAVSALLLPKAEYLPQGNRNLVINLLVPPPGLSYEERDAIGRHMFDEVAPYMNKEEHEGVPGIKNMFYVGTEGIMLAGAMSTQEQRAGELLPLFTRMIYSIPGMYGVSMQAGIFQTRLGRGRTVEVDLSGGDLDRVVQSAGMMFGKVREAMPDAQIRPVPSIEMLFPEVRILPDRDRLRANGMSAEDLGVAVDVLMDGRDVGDFKEEGKKKIDLVLMTSEEQISTPEALYAALVATPRGDIVPVSSLATLERTAGINQIRHLERNRTITLQVTPSFEMPLQAAIEKIQGDVITPMKEEGRLGGVDVRMSGAADKLTETRVALQWIFALAAVITYLLMAALFGDFIYPFVVLFTVPLAVAGGFVGLSLVNLFITTTPMDVLTMLGFVILIGVVISNSIIIVHQALNNVGYGMEPKEAVLESVRTRLRPILMSTSTSVIGMLPLVLFPGAGSELYRGLGSVIVGGLALSTVFTVFVTPALLVSVIGRERKKKGRAEGDV